MTTILALILFCCIIYIHFHLRLLAVNVINVCDLHSNPPPKNSGSHRLSLKHSGVLLCSSSSSAKVGLSSRYCWASDQVVRYVTLAMLSKMFFRASQFLFLSCLACSWKSEEKEEEEEEEESRESAELPKMIESRSSQ